MKKKGPVCPHCGKEIDATKLTTTPTGFGPENDIYVISCHHSECRKVLGITQIQKCEVEGLDG